MYTVEQIKKLIRTGQKNKFYDDYYWRYTIRPKILNRDRNECQECKNNNRMTLKQYGKKLDVHHIKELEQFPELAYEEDNLLTVCVSCHNFLDNKGVHKVIKEKFDNEERW